MEDYRCAYHAGEGRADALTVPSGVWYLVERALRRYSQRGSDPKDPEKKLPLEKVAGAMAGNLSVRKSFDQHCNLHSDLSVG